MLVRFISGVVGTIILVFALYFRNVEYLLNALLAIVSGIAVFELFRCVGIKNKALLVLSLIFGGAVQFYPYYNELFPIYSVGVIFVILALIIMVASFGNIKVTDAYIAIAAAFAIPIAFCSLIMINQYDYANLYPKEYAGLFHLILIFVCSWVTDIGAYFIGMFFGKRKLIPKISPKKTVEGAVGGALICVLAANLCAYIFNTFFFDAGAVSYVWTTLISLVLSPISMFGDLSASLLKRTYGIKDFGKIMPGHGGILDRFDSFIFVAPLMAAIILIFKP